ncbi:hypothetical protein SLITO_v1c07300 [Spiroplasma litorale]|uniref:Uncharacterized protein n=1 Tax=Spiroplasma litorale TaxID=216942 RepID=A0A0K1W211_9MOLU|nr:hypothetical protein SLITO_v1c07300 [Spiroplasma litorale]
MTPIVSLKICEFFSLYDCNDNYDLFVSFLLLLSVFLILNLVIFSLFLSFIFLCKSKKIKIIENNFNLEVIDNFINFLNINYDTNYFYENFVFQNFLLVSITSYKNEKTMKVFKLLNQKLRDKKKGTVILFFKF